MFAITYLKLLEGGVRIVADFSAGTHHPNLTSANKKSGVEGDLQIIRQMRPGMGEECDHNGVYN
jgi:hypothetical protein